MYIVLTEFNLGQKVSVFSSNLEEELDLLKDWSTTLNFPRLGVKSVSKIYNTITNMNFRDIVSLKGIKNIDYVTFHINGILIEANILKVMTSTNASLFSVFTYFKGGTYISQYENSNPLETIQYWAKHLSWRLYSKEDRDEIKNKIKELKNLNCIIDKIVWRSECSVHGNNLIVYVVKSYI